MTDEQGILNDVRDWLAKSGLPFEMKTAASLRSVALAVTQGEHFTDPVTGVDREIDVCGYFASAAPTHVFKVVVECKADTAPWVAFLGTGGVRPLVPVVLGEKDCLSCWAIKEHLEGLQKVFPSAYSITQKRVDRARVPDLAYEATQQAASAVLGSLGQDAGWVGHAGDGRLPLFLLPMVVTRAPLVACWLNDSGEVEVGPIGAVRVSVQRTDVPEREGDCVEVVVVNSDHLAIHLPRLSSVVVVPHSE